MTTLTPDELVRKQIKKTRFSSGYSIPDIDNFFARVAREWRDKLRTSSSPFPPSTLNEYELLNIEFPSAPPFKEGYDKDVVDDLIDDVVIEWRKLEPVKEPVNIVGIDLSDMSVDELLALSSAVSEELADRSR